MKRNDTLQFIIIPIEDDVNAGDIPSDIKEAAYKSVEMWEMYWEKENKKRIEEHKREIERLKCELEIAKTRSAFGCTIPYYPPMK